MSGKIKSLIATLLLILTSSQAWSQTGHASLAQLPQEISSFLQNMLQSNMSDLQKLQAINHQKNISEKTMRAMILSGEADPKDLPNPKSDVSLAFKAIDGLVTLAELQIDTKTGKATPTSCGEARSMLSVSNLKLNAEEISISGTDILVQNLINLMCSQKEN